MKVHGSKICKKVKMLHLNSKNSQIRQTYIEIKDLEFHLRSKRSNALKMTVLTKLSQNYIH